MGNKVNSGKRWKAARRKRLLQNVQNIARRRLANKQIAGQELDDTAPRLDVECTIEKPSSSIVHNIPQAHQNEFQEDNSPATEIPSSLIQSDINLHEELDQTTYEAERETEKLSIGRRVINVSNFFKSLQEISSHGPLDCGFKSIEIVSERLVGLTTKLKLKCRLCNMSFIIDGDNTPEEMNLNTCAVAGAISAGCGYTQLLEMTSTLGLPEISQKLFTSHMDMINKKWESEALRSMNEAAEEERCAAVKESRVNAKGIPIIDVIADGCWGKRSYKKNYSSLSGAAAILGRRTNKILFMAVKNKFCYICARAENKGTSAKDHICYKNYTGPSTGMESTIIVEGFKKSIEMHNLIYGRIISDGDANTYSKLLQERPYENLTIEKIECRNHLLRNFCNKLQSLSTDTKFLIRFRKFLTKKRILTMRKVIVTAIAKYRHTDNAMQLHADIMLAAEHAFGQHSTCKGYFCVKLGEVEDFDKEFYTSTLWQKIKLILAQLAAHSRSLLHDVDSNSVERYHSIIAKFVGGKRINFSQKYQYQMRCNTAALSFNTKKPLSILHKSIVGRSPRGQIHKFETSRLKRLNRSMKYPKKRKRTLENQTASSINYGQNCAKPDMTKEMLEESKKIFLKNLEKSEDERIKIERGTILQSESSEWLELRRNLLTASNFGTVIKRRNDVSCANMVKNLIYKNTIDHVTSIKHGLENESTAKAQLEKEKLIKIHPCGLFIDEEIPFLGASPDGIIDENTICEIKCPISAYKLGLDKAIAEKKITFYKKIKDSNKIIINKDHSWYYQIQGQLHITKKEKCLFGLWSGQNTTIQTDVIHRDDNFWEVKMKNKLITFYTECILPELVDPRHPRKMPIRDPEYISHAIEIKRKRRENKENFTNRCTLDNMEGIKDATHDTEDNMEGIKDATHDTEVQEEVIPISLKKNQELESDDDEVKENIDDYDYNVEEPNAKKMCCRQLNFTEF